MLPETNGNDACQMAERLRQKLENTPETATGKNISITASFGVAFCEQVEKNDTIDGTLTKLLQQADQALYLAKNRGRNQVALSMEEASLS